jgi:hypothetical protein
MKQFTESNGNYTGTGRVLRIKEGFNPNSSSCGSIVFTIHSAMVAAPVLLAGAAAWIAARMLSGQPSGPEPAADKKDGGAS